MKKILSFFLVAAMILSLVACNTTGESAVSSSSPSSNSSLEGEQNAVESNLPENQVPRPVRKVPYPMEEKAVMFW